MRVGILFGALALLCAFPAVSRAGYIALSLNDLGNNTVAVHDSTTMSLLYTWAPDGPLADIAIDQATGMLYAATQGGVYRRHISVGSATTSLGINNFVMNSGGDLEVHGGILTYHASDSIGNTAIVFNTNTNSFLPNFAPDGLISDVAINATDGMVYAATQAGIFRRHASGGPITFPGIQPFSADAGGDIAVLGNHLVYNLHDFQNGVNVWNLTTNSFLPNWVPDGRVSDIAIEHTTGMMYAATQGGIYRRSITGGPTTSLGIASFSQNSGGDIAVYSASALEAVPEPSSVALLGLGLSFAGLGVGKRVRRNRQSGLAA
jgi:hypothetical protein